MERSGECGGEQDDTLSPCAPQPHLTRKIRSFIVAVFLIVATTRAASIAMGRRVQAVRLSF